MQTLALHYSLAFSRVLAGTRKLSYSSDAIWISIGSNDYKLVEKIEAGSFVLAKEARDLNNDGSNEIAFFEVGFRLNEIGTEFNTKIFPRHMVEDN